MATFSITQDFLDNIPDTDKKRLEDNPEKRFVFHLADVENIIQSLREEATLDMENENDPNKTIDDYLPLYGMTLKKVRLLKKGDEALGIPSKMTEHFYLCGLKRGDISDREYNDANCFDKNLHNKIAFACPDLIDTMGNGNLTDLNDFDFKETTNIINLFR